MARPRQVSDEQILAATRKSVLSQGLSVPLDQVAEPLAVSVPALLKRFGSRKALMLAALRPPAHPAWMKMLERGPDDRPLIDQLAEMFSTIAAYMDESIPCLTALRESGIRPTEIFSKNGGPFRGLKAIQGWLASAKRKGLVTAPEVASAAFAILGALQTRAFYSHVMKTQFSQRERNQYTRELAELFSRALHL